MKSLKKETIISVLVFIIGIVLLFILVEPETANKMISDFFEGKTDILAPDGSVSALGLLRNNVSASLVMFLTGLIPFIFFPLIGMFVNGAIIGALFKLFYANGVNILALFIRGILPHGIFEIPALIISAAMGVKLCTTVIGKIRKKDVSIGETLKELGFKFITVVVPLLIVAALVEAYITPVLLGGMVPTLH